MSARRQLEEQASTVQRRAADPGVSAWVAASAGSGKTKVLADRMLRLLLAGVEATRLLCLTFTKAAADEMANRVQGILAQVATESVPELDQRLRALLGRAPKAIERSRARALFARVLDAPGGLKVMTLHAFCQSVLRRFPLEASVAPHFEVIDERAANEALAAAKLATLVRASGGDPALASALAVITRELAEDGFDDLMQALARERARLQRLLQATGGTRGAIARTAQALGIALEVTPESVLTAAVADGAFDRAALTRAAAALAAGGKRDIEKAERIQAWLALDEAGRAHDFDAYIIAFLTKELAPRADLAGKAVLAVAGVEAALAAEQARVLEVLERKRKAKVLEATAALLTLGGALLEAYARGKMARGQLDYDDLVLKTAELLGRPGLAAWVLFKLDGGIDHILIDEGQDTNPEQWRVVAALAEEFFVGKTAGDERRPVPRTVFAVGDVKQSIFSFQRADPAVFAAMRAHFRAKVEASGGNFAEVPLDFSFRSTSPVLDAVDRVFAQPQARQGVIAGDASLKHLATRSGDAGLVELWPPLPPPQPAPPEAWAPPIERVAGDSPADRLARLIAKRIKSWLATGEMLDAKARAIRPDDVLILLRKRKPFAPLMVRALKALDIPVAGVDRMVLTDQLAVMDLMALGQFLLLPEDDLTLACVLKGPLIGLDEDALFRLAHGRKSTLLAALAEKAAEEEVFARAHDYLSSLLARVDFQRPYELYAELLGRGGEARMLARLGPDAEDPLEEFLSLALAYERAHTPSLQGFLAWLVAGEAEIKRDLDHGAGAVRVMTVHGAKGLQAPIVFLPDTLGLPLPPKPALLWLKPQEALLWPPRRGDQDAVAAAAYDHVRGEQIEEYRRLLYVAMTRAADRLYVCGFHNKKGPQAGNWHELIASGVSPVAERVPAPWLDGEVGPGAEILRLARPQTVEPQADTPSATPGLAQPLPAWASNNAPPDAPTAAPYTPSRPTPSDLESDEPPVLSPLMAQRRFRRGLLIHRLLETLPEVSKTRRAAACRRYLSAPLHGLAPEEQAEIATTVLDLLAAPSLAALFGPESLAEAPLAGIVPTPSGPVVVSGQVDRLHIGPQQVVVIDYKTNRPPPADEDGVSRVYLRQMAAYRALLRLIYPGRTVRCALLWTSGPRLMWLGDARLDAHAPGRGAVDLTASAS
ncbi:MAG: double-strand break repair helicase AddA [Alphaproteobacteria bacterium]|nr:double-strand break repair helicase AddA [Alphaproteobacteria bacterium]